MTFLWAPSFRIASGGQLLVSSFLPKNGFDLGINFFVSFGLELNYLLPRCMYYSAMDMSWIPCFQRPQNNFLSKYRHGTALAIILKYINWQCSPFIPSLNAQYLMNGHLYFFNFLFRLQAWNCMYKRWMHTSLNNLQTNSASRKEAPHAAPVPTFCTILLVQVADIGYLNGVQRANVWA